MRVGVWVVVGSLLVGAACANDPRPSNRSAPSTTAGPTGATTTVTSSAAPTSPPAGAPTAGPARFDGAFEDAFVAVDRFVDAEGLNGAGLVIVTRDDGIVAEHYAGEFGPGRVSLIASSSKMLTAGVLVRLADQGELDLDAPVADVVSWGAANPAVTPAQLLSNSSGLVGLDTEEMFAPYLCQYVWRGTLQECAERIFTTTEDDALVVAPDTEFRYGGGQWQVAGAVAEAASGRTWAELIDETYVKPCGTRSLAYNNHFAQMVGPGGPFNYPTPFGADPASLEATENPNMEGGAYIGPRDYAAILVMHLSEGRCGSTQVISAGGVRRMHADRVGPTYGARASRGQGYGLGWWVSLNQPGLIQDAGAFGAVPWLDLSRGYGAYLVIEDDSRTGDRLARLVRPMIEQVIDGDTAP